MLDPRLGFMEGKVADISELLQPVEYAIVHIFGKGWVVVFECYIACQCIQILKEESLASQNDFSVPF